MDDIVIILVLITALAAIVNGGVGYGFSSITMPVALIFYTNRILNPAIVLIEIIINAYVMGLHLKTVKSVFRHIVPLLIGGGPGILIGATILSWVDPDWIKLITYALLLPMILMQAVGVRRKPGQSKQAVTLLCGCGIGCFYAITMISGPLLAIFLISQASQALDKKEFRAAMSTLRLVLSSVTVITYFNFGFFQPLSMTLFKAILPSVLVGIPLGAYLIRKMNATIFRRICISFDIWCIGFSLSNVIAKLKIIISPYAYIVLLLAVLIDGCLLYRHFSKKDLLFPWRRRLA